MSLTQDGVRTIIGMEKGADNPGFQPILQAISVKPVSKGNNDRFRVVLSDGAHYIQGMLASQMNHLVKNNELRTNNLICIKNFMNNAIQGRTVTILLEIEVVGNSDERIGNPANIEKAGNAALNSATAAHQKTPAVAPMYGSGGASGAAPSRPTATPPRAPSSSASSASRSKSNPYGSSSPSRMGTSRTPIARSTTANGTPITSIASLNMYQNRWTIKARVVSKSDIRSWSNSKGEGTLFSVEVLDSSGTDVKCTFFREAVEKFYNMLVVGSVFTFSGGRLGVANRRYNSCKSPLEITFDQNAEIHLQDDADDIQAQSFELVKIADIETVEANKTVDVIGICKDPGEVVSFIAKKSGREMTKRDVEIVDDSTVQIRVTLWGQDAVNFDQQCEIGKVVAFRRARVSDYGGKTLSASSGGTIIEPKVPETAQLQQWYSSNGGANMTAKSLSSSGGTGGRMDSFADRKVISDIKSQNLGMNSEKGDYLSFKGHFTFLRKSKEGGAWYTACPNPKDPCRNRCKVSQNTEGSWQCDRCSGTYATCDRKWIFSGIVTDATSSTWVSIFDEQATQMFNGATANDVFAEYSMNQDAYDGHFARANFTEWIFKCRVRNEMVNNEPRLKTQVVRMDPVNYVQESNDMLAALEKMKV